MQLVWVECNAAYKPPITARIYNAKVLTEAESCTTSEHWSDDKVCQYQKSNKQTTILTALTSWWRPRCVPEKILSLDVGLSREYVQMYKWWNHVHICASDSFATYGPTQMCFDWFDWLILYPYNGAICCTYSNLRHISDINNNINSSNTFIGNF